MANSLFNISNRDQILVLVVKELLSEFSNKEIMEATKMNIDKGFSNFVLDLSHIEYMNSVGLNFMIGLKKLADDLGGKLVISNASLKVLQLLEMTKLTDIFILVDDRAAAFKSFENNA